MKTAMQIGNTHRTTEVMEWKSGAPAFQAAGSQGYGRIGPTRPVCFYQAESLGRVATLCIGGGRVYTARVMFTICPTTEFNFVSTKQNNDDLQL